MSKRRRPPSPAVPAPAPPSSAWAEEAAAWRMLGGEARSLGGLLLGLLGVAALVRFPTLGQHELWLDEASMFFDAQSHSFNNVSRLHVLHVHILGWFLDALGESPVVLRLWSALAGTLAVPVLALAAAWMAGGLETADPERPRRWALIAGLVAAVSPYLVYYSQDANYYGAMTLFAALQWAALVAFVRGASLGATATIVAVGLASHFTHPLGSLMTATAVTTALGALVFDGRLRRQWFAVSPGRWLARPGLPIVVLVLGAATWLAWEPVQALVPALMKRGERPPTPDVSWHPMFFVRTFSIYALGLAVERLPMLIAFGGAMLVGMVAGAVRSLSMGRTTRVVAIQLALATAAALVVIFTIRHHGFYPRYFTFLVPGFVLMGAVAMATVGEWLAQRAPARAQVGRWLPAAAVALPLAASTALLFHPARRNAEALTEVLAAGYQPGDLIILPERSDLQQTAYYFPRATPPIPLDARVVVESADWLDQTTRSFLVHRLAGGRRAWVVSLRRGFQRPATRDLIERDLGPPAFRGWSVEGSDFDAILVDATKTPAIELPHAARRDGLRVIEPPAALSRSDVRKLGPFDTIQFTDDRRNREAVLDDGTPVLRRRFDGSASHLIYSSPTEPRAIEVFVGGRAPDANKPLLVAVAVNGVHQGTWPAVARADQAGRLVSISTGIVPPPGNVRVDVHGFTPRTGYDPYNDWEYGGLWLRAASNSPAPAPTWESSGVQFVDFPTPLLRWEHHAPMATHDAYDARVAPEVRGPSGGAALEIDLGAKPSNAYVRFFSAPLVVGTADFVAYSTYLKVEGTRSHAASLATLWLDADQRPITIAVGTQQYLMTRFSHGWSRFVEVAPVPADHEGRRAAFVLPGVMVFPPDPDKPTSPGRVWVDAMASLHDAKGPFAEPSLDPSMVFDVVVRDGVAWVASGS